ncbi:MAG: hypothetical protein IAG13_18015, partial [Deltaproteobacteria bacterium]|nr:hypothetical protein [Nannocystaceae bacterium]
MGSILKSIVPRARPGAMRASQRNDGRRTSCTASRAMSRRCTAGLVALATSMTFQPACQPVAPGDAAQQEVATRLAAIAPDGDALVFPPEPARRERRTLPGRLHGEGDDAGIGVVVPELDEHRAFEMSGQRLRIAINEPIDAGLGVPLGTEVRIDPTASSTIAVPLQITPPVAGKLVAETHALVFTADAPFDPEREYELSLSGLRDARGTAVLSGWTAKFRADPELWIGGKMLSYLPEPGAPRIVAILPDGGGELGVRPRFEVLFDQPVTAASARGLLALERPTLLGARTVPSVLTPLKGKVFGGVAVPAGHVMVLSSALRLDPGSDLVLVRKDPGVSDYQERTEFDIAERLAFTGVECWSSDACTWRGGVLTLSGGSFSVRYTNAIATKGDKLDHLVKVTPAVPNLSVWNDTWSSTGNLNVSGGFAPSSHYEVEVVAQGDRFGQRTGKLSFAIDTAPLPASAAMTEGAVALAPERARAYPVVTRNLESAKLELWRIGDDAESVDAAGTQLNARERLARAPDHVVDVRPEQQRDADVTTVLDLSAVIEPGRPYLAVLSAGTPAFGAKLVDYPKWSSAARAPTAMFTLYDEAALAVHTEATRESLIVHVARVQGGMPVAGASFTVAGRDLSGLTTDADGIAVLPISRELADKGVLHVAHGGAHAQIRLARGGAQATE